MKIVLIITASLALTGTITFDKTYRVVLPETVSIPSYLMPVQPDSLIAPGATLQKVSGQFSFTEGPAVDKKGNIYFTDQPNDKIWKYDLTGKLSVFLDKTGRSNGMYFDHKGNLLTCADEKDELWRISPKGKVKVLLKSFQGHRFNGPNDVWVSPQGNIYFTDPYYQRPYWSRTTPDIKEENVFFLPKGEKYAMSVEGDLLQPNGIVGTPDGKYLYVADIKANKTYRYGMNAYGTLQDKELFIQQGSDGMTLDNEGNIYLTGNGVTVYNSKGEKLMHITVPAKWTSNVCFGGRNRKTLFITASESIYTLEMNVKGVE